MNKLIASDDGLIFRCPYYRFGGFCGAALDANTNDDRGECQNPLECKHRNELEDN